MSLRILFIGTALSLLLAMSSDQAYAGDPISSVMDRGSKRANDFGRDILPLLERHCFRCHNEQDSEADLRLDDLGIDFGDSAAAETWHDVLNRLNLGEMPPEGESQPTADELARLVDWLTAELKQAAEAKRLAGGQTLLRRLTRYEYGNTLRDLLGVDLDFAQDLPPESVSKDGFQNNGAALGMSPIQIELYLQIARAGLDKAIVEGSAPQVFRHRAEVSEAKRKKNEPESTNDLAIGESFAARVMEFPREGEVQIRVRAGARIPEGARIPKMKLTMGMRSDVLTAEESFGEVDVTASLEDPHVYEFRRRIEQFPLPGHNPKYPGIKVTVWHGDASDAKKAKGKRRKKRKRDSGEEGDMLAGVQNSEPMIHVESVEFEGPIFEAWPPQSHARILIPRKADESESAHARRILRGFVPRAFRRPATDSELELFHSFYDATRGQWPRFEDAMKETLAMVLVSPEFLYRIEPVGPKAKRRRLSEFELASRLSYFLWSTMPDEKLSGMAADGSLSDPDVLTGIVKEMIANPRSDQFVEHFTDQWLNLSGVDRVAVNPEYYPDFKDPLKADMRGETRAFFAEILRRNLNALNFIDSDFAMLNRPLADHYGIEGPVGSPFVRVPLTRNDHRGGLLTQASILLSNSNGEDSHPIRRSVWLLDRLLGSPPAPPPPDVPELDSEAPDFAVLSVREQLELHREKDSCNNCHQGIDPWGIALENYDAVGRWRTEIVRRVKKGRDKKLPLVTESVLPGNHAVAGPADLKRHLLEHEQDRFSETLVRKLLSYGLGRSLDLSDEPSVDALNKSFAESEYRFGDLMIAIVQSEPFQHN